MRRREFFGIGLAGLGALTFTDKAWGLQYYPKPASKKWAVLYASWCGSARDAAAWVSEGMGGIADTHNHIDVPLTSGEMPGPDIDIAGELKRSGLAAICMTYATDYQPGAAYDRFLKGLASMDRQLERSRIKRSLTPEEVRTAHKNGQPGIGCDRLVREEGILCDQLTQGDAGRAPATQLFAGSGRGCPIRRTRRIGVGYRQCLVSTRSPGWSMRLGTSCNVRSCLRTTSAQVDPRRCGSSDAPSRPKASP